MCVCIMYYLYIYPFVTFSIYQDEAYKATSDDKEEDDKDDDEEEDDEDEDEEEDEEDEVCLCLS